MLKHYWYQTKAGSRSILLLLAFLKNNSNLISDKLFYKYKLVRYFKPQIYFQAIYYKEII